MTDTCKQFRAWPRPLGMPFSDKLLVKRVDEHTAKRFYEENHSYMPYLNRVTTRNYGGYLDGELVGCVTFCKPRITADINGVDADDVMEVARVAVSIDMSNLASCLMSKVQDLFIEEWGRRNGVKMLLTFVAEPHEGSMFKALEGKGWRLDGEADSRESGNRENRDIQTTDKTRWICPVEYEDDGGVQLTFSEEGWSA